MFRKIINLVKKILIRIDGYYTDLAWFAMGMNCFSTLFPPSFYMTHTQEEIEEITKKALAEFKKLIDEFDDDEQNKGD